MMNIKFLITLGIILLLTGCGVNRGNLGEMMRSLNNKSHGYVVEKDPTNTAPTEYIEKFEVRNGDCAGNAAGWNDCEQDRQRSELSERNKSTFTGNEYWYGWSIYLPKDFVHLYPATVTMGQFHQKDTHPVFLFQLNENAYAVSELTKGAIFSEWKLAEIDQMRGKWTKIEVHVKWDKYDDGFFKVWINGKKKINYIGKTMTASAIYFKYGIYQRELAGYKFKGNYNDPIPTQTVYYSNVKRTNSREELEVKKKEK